MSRTAADNLDLDLMIAGHLGLTVDQVDELPLEAVELMRQALWERLVCYFRLIVLVILISLYSSMLLTFIYHDHPSFI